MPQNAVTFSHPLFQQNAPELFEQFCKDVGSGKQLGRSRKSEPKKIVVTKEKDYKKEMSSTKLPINREPSAARSETSPTYGGHAKTKQAEKDVTHCTHPSAVAGMALPLGSRNTTAASMMLHQTPDLSRLAPSSSLLAHDEHFLRQQQLLDLSFSRPPLLSSLTRTPALSASLLLGHHKARSIFDTAHPKPPPSSTSLQYMLERQRLLSSTPSSLAVQRSNGFRRGSAHERLEQLNLEMAVAEAAAARRRRLSASLWAGSFP